MQTESVGQPQSGVSTEIVARYTVDVHTVMFLSLLAPSPTSSCQGSMGTEVWQTGEVSVSYYSLVNTSTFPFCGNTVTSAHPGLLASSHTNADASVCAQRDSAAQSTLSHRSKCWCTNATLALDLIISRRYLIKISSNYRAVKLVGKHRAPSGLLWNYDLFQNYSLYMKEMRFSNTIGGPD